MTIQEDIQKIIDWIKIEGFQKKVLKNSSYFRKLDTDIGPQHWENSKKQETEIVSELENYNKSVLIETTSANLEKRDVKISREQKVKFRNDNWTKKIN